MRKSRREAVNNVATSISRASGSYTNDASGTHFNAPVPNQRAQDAGRDHPNFSVQPDRLPGELADPGLSVDHNRVWTQDKPEVKKALTATQILQQQEALRETGSETVYGLKASGGDFYYAVFDSTTSALSYAQNELESGTVSLSFSELDPLAIVAEGDESEPIYELTEWELNPDSNAQQENSMPKPITAAQIALRAKTEAGEDSNAVDQFISQFAPKVESFIMDLVGENMVDAFADSQESLLEQIMQYAEDQDFVKAAVAAELFRFLELGNDNDEVDESAPVIEGSEPFEVAVKFKDGTRNYEFFDDHESATKYAKDQMKNDKVGSAEVIHPKKGQTESVAPAIPAAQPAQLDEASSTVGLFVGCYVRVIETSSNKQVDRGLLTKVGRTCVSIHDQEYDQSKYKFIRFA